MVFCDKDIIDWDSTIQLCANNKDFAKEILVEFVRELPQLKQDLITALAANNRDNEKIRSIAHLILGGACYCATPRLKKVLIESKHHQRYDEVIAEIDAVIDEYNKAL